MSSPTNRRRTFGPIVLVGLVAGALGAVAGSHAWVVDGEAAATGDPVPGITVSDPVAASGEMPLALALSLVVLAVWGVVLVTRGRVRRGVASLGVLASGGLVATVITGYATLDERVAEAILERTPGAELAATELTGWFWVAALTAVLSLVATVLAFAWAPRWPEMGRRYDAPGSEEPGVPVVVAPEERDNLDLWKSMDRGHDPTA